MSASWIWPEVGPAPVNQGLDSEMFDRTDYPYTETFVREAIQNSLDARLNKSKPVTMRFTFHAEKGGAQKNFLEQAMRFRAEAGLDVPDEWRGGQVKWLSVEDFNARGLADDLTKRNSDFWNYWLNFGLSNKDGSGRGGRGIGRVTFLIASRIHSVIGHTRGSNGNTASCGMAVLRAMPDGNGFRSTHAYLARDVNGSVYQLHDAPEFHAELRKTFRFAGYDGEFSSGLALAVPYPHQELTSSRILAAAIENFAPAIIDGLLRLDVDDRELSADSILQVAMNTGVTECFNNRAIRGDVKRYLNLIKRSLAEQNPARVFLPGALVKDLQNLRQAPSTGTMQKSLSEGNHVIVSVAFPLERNGTTNEVDLRAILRKTPEACEPIERFFREGMALPEVRARNPGELDAVLLVDDGPLATYLNCCEGKAHLDLLESNEVRQKLTDTGFNGVTVKRLVKRLPGELRNFLIPDTTAPDAQVFDRFFAKPSDKPAKTRKKPKEPPGVSDPPEPVRKPPIFITETLMDGLRIRANPDCRNWPLNVTVTLAYADGTRRASWSRHDFRLRDLNIQHSGCNVEVGGNRMQARDCGPETAIAITGFDANRELDATIRPWRYAQKV